LNSTINQKTSNQGSITLIISRIVDGNWAE